MCFLLGEAGWTPRIYPMFHGGDLHSLLTKRWYKLVVSIKTSILLVYFPYLSDLSHIGSFRNLMLRRWNLHVWKVKSLFCMFLMIVFLSIHILPMFLTFSPSLVVLTFWLFISFHPHLTHLPLESSGLAPWSTKRCPSTRASRCRSSPATSSAKAVLVRERSLVGCWVVGYPG